jgi:Mn2+/Fe2+ NRAMP family transporter
MKNKMPSAILGAAFLMATSAIGPGFLTQTTVFTEKLMASFAFVILLSILLDIGAQLTIWRVLTMSGLRAQDLANKLLPGLGYVLAGLILMGGFVFNTANMGGCGLGLQIVTGLSIEWCAAISCLVALVIFWMKEFGKALDTFTKILGVVMILLTFYVAVSSNPPIGEALKNALWPQQFDSIAIVTLVGGTVGGYISFAGAHRLLDAGISGEKNLSQVSKSAVSGIVITGVMRVILFLAVLGVVMSGVALAKQNPAASVFQIAAGNVGYKFFGVVMWCAAITSVVGCAYTSISFIRSLHATVEKYNRQYIAAFIVISTFSFLIIGNPVKLLVSAGAVNGLILPLALAVILLASRKATLMGKYKHPVWMQVFAWCVVVVMTAMSIYSLGKWIAA